MTNIKNVGQCLLGSNALGKLPGIVAEWRSQDGFAAYLVDGFFEDKSLKARLEPQEDDLVIFLDTNEEPTTQYVDEVTASILRDRTEMPSIIVGIGGGSSLDIAKAVSNLLANGGNAADYQGWDLVPSQGIYKIGVPTLSGTGAESSRTCVMMNKQNNVKLGMNSNFSVFDQIILDPDLSRTVEKDQYFTTGMDTYVHCVESLHGQYRNLISDAFSHQALALSREIFFSADIMSDENRERMMVASYLGGCGIANGLVGLVHPPSSGLSMVLGIRHGLANCIVLEALDEFYPKEVEEFREFKKRNNIQLPTGVCSGLSDSKFDDLYEATIVHEKPLENALGSNFRDILTKKKLRGLFEAM